MVISAVVVTHVVHWSLARSDFGTAGDKQDPQAMLHQTRR